MKKMMGTDRKKREKSIRKREKRKPSHAETDHLPRDSREKKRDEITRDPSKVSKIKFREEREGSKRTGISFLLTFIIPGWIEGLGINEYVDTFDQVNSMTFFLGPT